MSKFKFFITGGLALLFFLTATNSSVARNNPRPIDHLTQYSHPWGGDENSGGSLNVTVTPVYPKDSDPYRYVDGTKTGIVFGVFQFIWDNVEVFLTSYTRGSDAGGKTAQGSSATGSSFTTPGSNTASSAGFGGKGGQ